MHLWHLFLRRCCCCCHSQTQDEEGQPSKRKKSSTKSEHELPKLPKLPRAGQTNTGYDSDYDGNAEIIRVIKNNRMKEEEPTRNNAQTVTSQPSRHKESRDNLNKLPQLPRVGQTNNGYVSDDDGNAETFRVKYKNMVIEEEPTRRNAQIDTSQLSKPKDSRDNLNKLIKPQSSRKLFQELIANTDFSRVDTYVINAGKELKRKKIYSVETIAQTIINGTTNDLERLRAVWIWLCDNIEYDVEGFLGVTKKLYSPDDVIRTGKAVCSGYAGVCLQLCNVVGIECREVNGYGKGVGYEPGQKCQGTNHAWNAVNLEGHWHLLDSCWGAGNCDMSQRVFNKCYNEFYFLTDPEEFINDHYPAEEKWQLLERPVNLKEFEKKVTKSAQFYRLGLTLIHPKQCSLDTENGEATISMGLSEPANFTYTISQCNGSKKTELSKSRGLLTITKSSMKLRVIPPTAGSFEVELFARAAGVTGSYSHLCSFLLKCAKPKPFEDLPENPSLCWGISPDGYARGLRSCEYGGEVIELRSGRFELVLQTARPLRVICSLSHKDLDGTLATRCVASQAEAEKLTCSVLCPYTGYYTLSVYVRDYESGNGNHESAASFLLHCTSNPVNLNELFPPDLSNKCGPGLTTTEAGLSQFSHTGAIVTAQQGKCNITFQNQQDISLHAVLSKEQCKLSTYPLSRYSFVNYDGSMVTISIALPEPGSYLLRLFGNSTHLCDFIIQNSSDISCPPFPCTYSSWEKGGVLLEPQSGLLEPLSWVRIRVKVAGVYSVHAKAEETVDLELNNRKEWEGKVFTGKAAQVQLMVRENENSVQRMVLMYFDVLKPQK
uniref:Transglutaminase-like domain-containing protein n=1 Tax=Astyanax mexicanus TaxID=7994 RepID=A0A3B1JMY2_ASTMX